MSASDFNHKKHNDKLDHAQHFTDKGTQAGYVRQERHGGNGHMHEDSKKHGGGGKFTWGSAEDDIRDYEHAKHGPGPNTVVPKSQAPEHPDRKHRGGRHHHHGGHH